MKSAYNRRPITLLLLLLITGISTPYYVFAQKQLQCPRGIYDCRGLCGWYIDGDRDGYCDYSAFTPEVLKKLAACRDSIAKVKLDKEKARLDSIARTEKASQIKTGQNNDKDKPKGTDPENNTVVLQSDKETGKPCNTECPFANQSVEHVEPAPVPAKNVYDLFSVGGTSALLYLLTFFLSRKGTISRSTHRKIWNVLLLITFLATGGLGLFLVVQFNYNLQLDWFSSLLYWHVEFGIGMAFISIFHVLWHLKYFAALFKTAPKKVSGNPS